MVRPIFPLTHHTTHNNSLWHANIKQTHTHTSARLSNLNINLWIPQLHCFWICQLEFATSITSQSFFVFWTILQSTENISVPWGLWACTLITSWQHSSEIWTSVFGWQTFPNLRLIYRWHVTTSWVNCMLWIDQPGQLSLPSTWGR